MHRLLDSTGKVPGWGHQGPRNVLSQQKWLQSSEAWENALKPEPDDPADLSQPPEGVLCVHLTKNEIKAQRGQSLSEATEPPALSQVCPQLGQNGPVCLRTGPGLSSPGEGQTKGVPQA